MSEPKVCDRCYHHFSENLDKFWVKIPVPTDKHILLNAYLCPNCTMDVFGVDPTPPVKWCGSAVTIGVCGG